MSNSNQQTNNNGNIKKFNKVATFVKNGFKNAMTTRGNEIAHTNEVVKSGIVGVVLTFKDFFIFLGSGVVFLFYYLLNTIITFKTIPSQFQKAAKNNFRLGISALRYNNIVDARIRFLLSNMFFNKSPTTKYYVAYSYYLEHKYTKSLKYLRSALQLEPDNKKCIGLVKQIEEELKENNIVKDNGTKTNKKMDREDVEENKKEQIDKQEDI